MCGGILHTGDGGILEGHDQKIVGAATGDGVNCNKVQS